jgi:hypothetical protein
MSVTVDIHVRPSMFASKAPLPPPLPCFVFNVLCFHTIGISFKPKFRYQRQRDELLGGQGVPRPNHVTSRLCSKHVETAASIHILYRTLQLLPPPPRIPPQFFTMCCASRLARLQYGPPSSPVQGRVCGLRLQKHGTNTAYQFNFLTECNRSSRF